MQESAVVFELLWATHFTSEIISPRSRRPWKVGLSAVIFANYNNSTTLLTPPLIIRLQFIRPLTLQIFWCPLTTNVIKCHKCCSFIVCNERGTNNLLFANRIKSMSFLYTSNFVALPFPRPEGGINISFILLVSSSRANLIVGTHYYLPRSVFVNFISLSTPSLPWWVWICVFSCIWKPKCIEIVTKSEESATLTVW